MRALPTSARPAGRSSTGETACRCSQPDAWREDNRHMDRDIGSIPLAAAEWMIRVHCFAGGRPRGAGARVASVTALANKPHPTATSCQIRADPSGPTRTLYRVSPTTNERPPLPRQELAAARRPLMKDPTTIVQPDSGHDPGWPGQKCHHCGKDLPRSRSDRKWCTEACRVAAWRHRKLEAKDQA